MKKEELKTLINHFEDLQKRTFAIHDWGLDLVNYEDDFYKFISFLMNKIFTNWQVDLIESYCFENDFGKTATGDEPKTIEELHKELFL